MSILHRVIFQRDGIARPMDQGPLTLALSREGNGDVTVYLVRIPFPLAGEG